VEVVGEQVGFGLLLGYLIAVKGIVKGKKHMTTF
jgi:hypothetical protein